MIKGEFIFRQIKEPKPAPWVRGLHWQVEFHHDSDCGYPIGTAYVSADDRMVATLGARATLDFIIVVDHMRRCGVGSQLIEACQKRWPDIYLGSAISENRQRLLDSNARKLKRQLREASR